MKSIDASEARSVDGPESHEAVVALNLDELAGLANAITQALLAVEDWEFHSLVGLTPDAARRLRAEIQQVLRSSSRPQ